MDPKPPLVAETESRSMTIAPIFAVVKFVEKATPRNERWTSDGSSAGCAHILETLVPHARFAGIVIHISTLPRLTGEAPAPSSLSDLG